MFEKHVRLEVISARPRAVAENVRCHKAQSTGAGDCGVGVSARLLACDVCRLPRAVHAMQSIGLVAAAVVCMAVVSL